MAHKKRGATSAVVGGDSLLERIPESVLNEIFLRLEPETLTTLCSVACVSRTLHSSVNRALSSFSSVDLSAVSLDSQTFHGIIRRLGKIEKISLDCLRLNDSSVRSFLGPDIEELILLKCYSLSYSLLASIGRTCPNLRVLTLEYSVFLDKSAVFDLNIEDLLGNCRHLESLQIKVLGGEIIEYGFMSLCIYHVLPQTVKVLKLQPASAMDTLVYLNAFNYTNLAVPILPTTFGQTLTHVSLLLNVITDTLVRTLARCLPLLAELDLKDQPTSSEPADDLSDLGVQSLVGCRHLTSLSLIRRWQYIAPSFKRTTDMGMFLLSEGCKGLESIRLGGFSKGNAPISFLSLRGCKRVTDKGIALLLGNEGKISKTLSSLDLGHMPGITDNAIITVTNACTGLTEMRIRNCFHVTDASVKALALKGRFQGESKRLRRLDLYNCTALSVESFKFLKKPLFCGLQWIGIGQTRLISGDFGLAEVCEERQWLTICTGGCEVGCHDAWQLHKSL